MIFTRFFSRRRQATATPDIGKSLSEGEGPKHLQAYRRLTSLDELRTLAQGDPNAEIREVADGRYRQLLCGQEASPLDLTSRKTEVGHLEDQSILAQVAAEAREAEIRLAAIERLTDQAVLASRALGDAATAVRAAAAQRLEDREALEQVARGIGKKDKHVYRLVHTRLKELAEREGRPARVRAQCQDLCAKLEMLGRFENWGQDRALLDLLDRQWGRDRRTNGPGRAGSFMPASASAFWRLTRPIGNPSPVSSPSPRPRPPTRPRGRP
jgi:exonuclease SbcC